MTQNHGLLGTSLTRRPRGRMFGEEMKRTLSILWVLGLVAVGILCALQFSVDRIWPLLAAIVIFATVFRFRPALRIPTGVVLIIGVTAFVADVTLLRHRISLEVRTWSPIWDCEEIVDTLPSPSGRTTAYIVRGGFLDSAYWVYFSDGGIFPKHSYIETGATDVAYPKDIAGAWTGSVFSIANLRYDESSGKIYPTLN
jgi:hypothetical protein